LPYQELTQIVKGFLRGGCFLIRKRVLEKLGGFDTELGVTGNTLRYGEEIELQIRMREAGMRIAYAPILRIGHHVRSDKLNLWWVLRSEYARRRDKMVFDPISLAKASLRLLKTAFGRLLWTPVHLFNALTLTSYSFRKALYNIFQPLAYSAGEWMGVAMYKLNARARGSTPSEV
jgi:GT2 family glycosyltransferase